MEPKILPRRVKFADDLVKIVYFDSRQQERDEMCAWRQPDGTCGIYCGYGHGRILDGRGFEAIGYPARPNYATGEEITTKLMTVKEPESEHHLDKHRELAHAEGGCEKESCQQDSGDGTGPAQQNVREPVKEKAIISPPEP